MTPELEKKFDEEITKKAYDAWEKQGRNDNQKHGVINFLTGKGGIEIKSFIDKYYVAKKEIRDRL